MRVTWATHAGGRPRNEDRVVVSGPVFAVLDGMGGQAGGEVAATLAAEVLGSWQGPLLEAFGAVRDALRAREQQDPAVHGFGVVGTAIRLDERVTVAHVGDTRAWLVREGVVVPLTRDHTLAQVQRELFRLPPDARVEGENRVTRDLGGAKGPPEHWVDLLRLVRRAGDRFVLASDGAWRHLKRAELAELGAPELVGLAVDRGTDDNATVVLVEDT